MNPKDIRDESIRDLAAAICIQAAADYKRSLTGKWGRAARAEGAKGEYVLDPNGRTWLLRGKFGWHPATQEGIDPPAAYEKFFRSAWFQELSGLHNLDQVAEYLKRSRDEKMHKEW